MVSSLKPEEENLSGNGNSRDMEEDENNMAADKQEKSIELHSVRLISIGMLRIVHLLEGAQSG